MKLKTKVSIIMAVYNGEKHLHESINSILNQSFKDFEFIIIDDCSKDNSLKIIQGFKRKDSRIKIIKNKKNLKLPASLNKGLKIANGEYVARMDADDISLPERLKIQSSYLDHNKNVFLVGGGVININERGRELITLNPIVNFKAIIKKLPNKNLFYHPTIMLRNEGVKYREKFLCAQDYDLYLNLLSERKNLANLPNILLKYRVGSESISAKSTIRQFLFANKAKEFYKERLNTGRDNYAKFKITDITCSEIGEIENIDVVRAVIFSAFNSGDPKRARDISKRYISKEGVLNPAIIYYMISFLNKGIINFLTKVYKKIS